MKAHEIHDCEAHAREFTSTPNRPYHYVNSGLSNVYLVGVRYFVCAECELQSAEIPQVKSLLSAIAKQIVGKSSGLAGEEVRFLRKRLGKRSIDFAEMVSMSPQRYSELEAGRDNIAPDRDKLVRMIYKILSGDRKHLTGFLNKPEEFVHWITSIHGDGGSERITATWMQNRQWKVESEKVAA